MTKQITPDVVDNQAEGSAQTAVDIWQSILDKFKSELSESVFTKWIQGLEFVAEIDGVIQVAASSGVQRDRVNSEFLHKINTSWTNLDPQGRRVAVACWSDLPEDVRMLAEESRKERASAQLDAGLGEPALRSTNASLTFDTLVVAESNRVATTVARKIAADQATPAQTVYFYGRHGVGKTHLLRAIEAEMAKSASGR